MKNKIAIIGHGLAGAMLSQTFIRNGQDVDVYESNLPFGASTVAAGLVNPLIGPKLNLPLDIKKCLSSIRRVKKYYQRKENLVFYKELSLLRIFKNKNQAKRWNSQSNEFLAFVEKQHPQSLVDFRGEFIHAPYNLGVTKCFQLQVRLFLDYSKYILKERGCWIKETFDYSCEDYSKVIFAEGYRVNSNPWFNDIPFSPVRGETLEVSNRLPYACSNGTWAVPTPESGFIAGSTWDHQQLEIGPTQVGAKTIITGLNFLKYESLDITKQNSGIRSGTIDRNPIMGQHPEKRNIYLFNGFGSRGATTIPFYAERMFEFINNQSPLPDYVNIERFTKEKT